MNQRLNYATQRAEVLFGSYRRGDANDPERYVTAIAAVLTLYDFELIREVTDPRTGIQNTEEFMTFMPQSGELKRYCDGVAARRDRMAKLAAIPRPVPAERRLAAPRAAAPGSLANIFVPNDHRRYGEMVDWSKKQSDDRMWRVGKSSDGRPGIWVALTAWEGEHKRSAEQWKGYTSEDLLRIYKPKQQDEQVPFE